MILDGKIASKYYLEECRKVISDLKFIPKLVVIQVGENPASSVYIKIKNKVLTSIGVEFEHVKFEENVEEEIVKNKIIELNQESTVTAILLQLPLPNHLNERILLDTIDPKKDVDCLNSQNLGLFFTGETNLLPATPSGIIKLLEYYKIPIEEKNVCIIGRSNIVGKPLALAFSKMNATVTLCHSRTRDLQNFTTQADIVVAAIGRVKFFTEEYFFANQTVIDVGTNKINGILCGDVDFDKVNKIVENISPSPGGVGPMTVYSIAENMIRLIKAKSLTTQ